MSFDFVQLSLAVAGLGLFYGGDALSWQQAAFVNSFFCILIISRFRLVDFNIFATPFRFYLPSLILLLVILILATYVSTSPDALRGGFEWKHLAWIFWIPLIEEWVFRFGLGQILMERLGVAFGAYLASLIFATLHRPFSLNLLLKGEVYPVLNAFLLGMICNLMYYFSKRIAPCVLFHAVCNASIPIFLLSDARIFRLLKVMY